MKQLFFTLFAVAALAALTSCYPGNFFKSVTVTLADSTHSIEFSGPGGTYNFEPSGGMVQTKTMIDGGYTVTLTVAENPGCCCTVVVSDGENFLIGVPESGGENSGYVAELAADYFTDYSCR